MRWEMLELLPFSKWNILQVTEKGGYLVFILNEQDLDCAALDMVSQRLEKNSPEVLIVVEDTIRGLIGTILIAVMHCRSCVFLDVIKQQYEGTKGA